MQEIQLLKAIEQDARISVTDLADILNSTPEQVDGEMKKLAEEKVICGYHTVINWDKTNQDHVMALIEVNASERKQMVNDILKRMNISHRAAHFPQQLSGGQQHVSDFRPVRIHRDRQGPDNARSRRFCRSEAGPD